MKPKLYLNILIYFVFGFFCALVAIFYDPVCAKSTRGERISCGKVLSDGDIQVFETLECDDEREFLGEDNCSAVYRKDVNLTKQFKKRVKEKLYETKAEIKQKFTFTYDKRGEVKILPRDISSNFTVTSWKISPLINISVDKGVCSVSNQYRVYDKNFGGRFQYMCDGFVDIFCDSNGEIGINSDVRF